ncbi:MAG TPA: YciI family protein [Polyangiales bacterium]
MAQAKYMFIYHTAKDSSRGQPSPEEMQQMFAQWDAWKTKFKASVLDAGDGLKPSGKVLAGSVVTDGPYPEIKDIVSGYSIIQAESYEAALVVARENPMAFVPGASIEIRELAGY